MKRNSFLVQQIESMLVEEAQVIIDATKAMKKAAESGKPNVIYHVSKTAHEKTLPAYKRMEVLKEIYSDLEEFPEEAFEIVSDFHNDLMLKVYRGKSGSSTCPFLDLDHRADFDAKLYVAREIHRLIETAKRMG